MLIINSRHRYASLVIALHWITAVLIVVVYACMELRGLAPKGSALRGQLKPLHYMLGISVLALVAARLLVRLGAGGAPAIEPTISRWQVGLSHAMHFGLYAFMVAMPLLGWLTLSAHGDAIPFFGWQLPPLIGPDKALSDQLKDIHEGLATVGYFLIGLHAVAGLAHHYVLRDNTLRRMLPGRTPQL